MRITYLYAENIAGIKEGPKLDKIEINFNQDPKKIFTLLLGGNGCGKTVTLSLLHPFRETYDGRTVVRDGEKAYKEIHFVDGTDEYIIKHTWKPNKSYLSLNGEELNESGSIKIFNNLVKEKMGIDEDYFKIARLGSNVTNFINLTSGLRKTYVGNYLPYIDDYLSSYEVVKKKYTTLNKDLSNVASQLDKFPELDVLKDKAKTSEDNIAKHEKVSKKLNGKKVKLESNIEKEKELFETKYEISCNDDDIESLLSDIKELSEEYSKIKKIYSTLRTFISENYPYDLKLLKSKKIFNNLLGGERDKISNISTKIEKIKVELNMNKENSDKFSKEIEVYKKMNSIDYDSEIEELKDIITNDKSIIQSLENELKSMNKKDKNRFKPLESMDNIDLDYMIDIRTRIDKLYNSIEILLSKYNIGSEIDDKLISKKKTYETKLHEINIEIDEISTEIVYIESNFNMIDILKNRPKTCKDDSCSFIANAVDYRDNHYKQYDKLVEERDSLTDKKDSYESKLDIIEKTIKFNKEAKELYNTFLTLVDQTFGIVSFEESIGEDFEDFKEFLHMDISDIRELLNFDSELLYYKKFLNLSDLKTNLERNKKEISRLKKERDNNQKIITHYKEVETELISIEEKVSSLEEELEEMNEELSNRKTIESSLEKIIECYDKLKDLKTRIDEAKETQDKYDEYLEKIDEIDKELDSLEMDIDDNEDMLESYKEESSKINKDLNYVEVLSEDKKKLDTKFNYTKLIRDALDPKKGIPLLFIDKFLENIEIKTNELLDLAYGSTFRIKFDLTDRDFFIRVFKTFSQLEDISLASQGEISLTTVSLSLAMIQYMIKHYNILYLDEIDGTLSNQNRRVFLSMLEKQIEELGIEQIFIITHNKEFYSYPVNLILLNTDEIDFDVNDSELMENKHIDFNLEEYKETKDSKLLINENKRKRKKKDEE